MVKQSIGQRKWHKKSRRDGFFGEYI